jgi:hypothetical protein
MAAAGIAAVREYQGPDIVWACGDR